MLSNHHNVMRAVAFADVLIGAVQTPGRRSPVIVTKEMVRSMRAGSVIIDFAISTGGCIETSRPTTLRDPIYVAEEIIHCCIPNFPALVARTGSYAINNAALPYLRTLGRDGLVGHVAFDACLGQRRHLLSRQTGQRRSGRGARSPGRDRIAEWRVRMNWETIYRKKVTDVQTALSVIESNQRIYVGGGAGVPIAVDQRPGRSSALREEC